MEIVKTILSVIGAMFLFFFITGLVVKKIQERNEREPRRKELHWRKKYIYIDKEYFMENYRWCSHGKHYYDTKEDYQCMCYAR